MPRYVFVCKSCNKQFEATLHMDDLDKKGVVKCPECGSEEVAQQVAAFAAVTSKKS